VGADQVEEIGIGRAKGELERADLVLWLGPEGQGPHGAWEIEPQIDRQTRRTKSAPTARVSAVTGEGVSELKHALVATAREAMPKPGQAALNARQRALLTDATEALEGGEGQGDALLVAEQLRLARLAFDRLTGRAATEDMLDALFGRFCIGK
jgi:tRNA modification GTPase